jgi:predicted ferric reductase
MKQQIVKIKSIDQITHDELRIVNKKPLHNMFSSSQITKDFLIPHINSNIKNIYLCGPPPIIELVEIQLQDLNVGEKNIIKEEF